MVWHPNGAMNQKWFICAPGSAYSGFSVITCLTEQDMFAESTDLITPRSDRLPAWQQTGFRPFFHFIQLDPWWIKVQFTRAKRKSTQTGKISYTKPVGVHRLCENAFRSYNRSVSSYCKNDKCIENAWKGVGSSNKSSTPAVIKALKSHLR